MPKRARRAIKKRAKRASTRKSPRRKAAKKRSGGYFARLRSAATKNRKAQWIAYEDLQKQADEAWTKLRFDVKRRAPPATLIKDRNDLALLLGECNYMMRECMYLAARSGKF